MGCSRRQARRVVTEAHKEWMDLAFGTTTSINVTCCSSASLTGAHPARKARGNYACVIGCVAQLNKMMALGADQKGFRGHPTHYYRRNQGPAQLPLPVVHEDSRDDLDKLVFRIKKAVAIFQVVLCFLVCLNRQCLGGICEIELDHFIFR